MKYYDWNEKKNKILKKERKVTFEIILSYLDDGKILDRIKHPNQNKYPNQSIFIIEHENYAYLVPFAEDDEKIFLKTIIPCREATKKYLRENNNE